MPEVTFYRQRRFDGGTRTGIDIDGIEHWHSYIPSPDEGDSGIIWFVDVRLEGDSLPDDPDGVHRWFAAHAREITSSLSEFAQRYEIGLDAGPYPQRCRIDSLPSDVSGEIVVSAARRVEARQITGILTEIAASWTSLLQELDRMSRVA